MPETTKLPRTVEEATAAEQAASPATWQGLNLLGFALMAARDHLDVEGRESSETTPSSQRRP